LDGKTHNHDISKFQPEHCTQGTSSGGTSQTIATLDADAFESSADSIESLLSKDSDDEESNFEIPARSAISAEEGLASLDFRFALFSWITN
jgi:hypothetical protein